MSAAARVVASAVSRVCVVGSASRVSRRPDKAESAEVRAVVSALSRVWVVGSASRVSNRLDSAVSAVARVLASEFSAVAVVGSASRTSKRPDRAVSAEARVVDSAEIWFVIVVAKFSSSPIALAISLSVFNRSGAPLVSASIAAALVAIPDRSTPATRLSA